MAPDTCPASQTQDTCLALQTQDIHLAPLVPDTSVPHTLLAPDTYPAPPHGRCVRCQSKDIFGVLTTSPPNIGYCDLGTQAEPGGAQRPWGTAPSSKSATLRGISTNGTVSPQPGLIGAQHPGGVLPPPHNLSIGKGPPCGVHSIPPNTWLVHSILPSMGSSHSLL